jgi:hypothetical protein
MRRNERKSAEGDAITGVTDVLESVEFSDVSSPLLTPAWENSRDVSRGAQFGGALCFLSPVEARKGVCRFCQKPTKATWRNVIINIDERDRAVLKFACFH